ncbi:hypothetical protein ACFQKC_11040 [Halovenus rubra]|nr:hypothetical protein [Halovenus rubra]
MEETSLDTFVESHSEDDTHSATTVESATPTARWANDGQHCQKCDSPTQRLWNDDGTFVCSQCKSW